MHDVAAGSQSRYAYSGRSHALTFGKTLRPDAVKGHHLALVQRLDQCLGDVQLQGSSGIVLCQALCR